MLLDTHTWIWLNGDPDRLPQALKERLLDPALKFHISAISVWEVAVSIQKGRLVTVDSPPALIDKWQAAFPLRVLPITEATALLSRTLSFDHDDPADRFIAATAHERGLPLITVDPRLRSIPWLTTYWDVFP